MTITEATECQCGAFTLEADLDDGSHQTYSMSADTLEAKFTKGAIQPILNDQVYSNCNHCVNNWGIDLCACGSGETPDNCDNELEECGNQMQTLGEVHKTGFWR